MLEQILRELEKTNTKLVAVSKTKPNRAIMEVYNRGHKVFGENRVLELVDKQPGMPEDIEWHFIGHLQRNKVKIIAPYVDMIHSVDSLRLLKEIDKEAKALTRIIPCLLQFHIAEESTKFGLNDAEAADLLSSDAYLNFKNIKIVGVMGMATFTEDEDLIRREFRLLKRIFDNLKTAYFSTDPEFKEISMGMSGDYKIAIEEGSTMVRIGSLIFGERG